MRSQSPNEGTFPGLPELHAACAVFDINPIGARLTHLRSNAVYVLPHAHAVARLAPATPLRTQRAATTIAVTRWLGDLPDPVALAPLPGTQPVVTDNTVATFWPLRPTTPPPTAEELGTLMRRLHALTPPPALHLPDYRPLHRLREALDLDANLAHPALDDDDRRWLTSRTNNILSAYRAAEFPLGVGLVHADAHRENIVRGTDGNGTLIIDWDQVCFGPREIDLISALPDHFHTPQADRRDFVVAYGHDPTTASSDWTVLRDIAELRSLAPYIRLAPRKPDAADELAHRLESLRTDDRSALWRAVS